MSINPGFELPFGIQPTNPVPVDAWSGPFTAESFVAGVSAANLAIPSAVRFQSMEVRLIVGGQSYKYWYGGGTGDGDLVSFQGATGSTPTDYVYSFNGRTGSVQGVSGAVGGTGISVSGTTGSVIFTNTGVLSIDGLTGTITISPGLGIDSVQPTGQDIIVKAKVATVTKSYSDSGVGVATFDSDDFRIASSVVRLKATTITAQSGAKSLSDPFQFLFRGGTGQAISTAISGDAVIFNIGVATTGVCGAAYYDGTNFGVAADGKVTLNNIDGGTY
jgi:hypothetical protein